MRALATRILFLVVALAFALMGIYGGDVQLGLFCAMLTVSAAGTGAGLSTTQRMRLARQTATARWTELAARADALRQDSVLAWCCLTLAVVTGLLAIRDLVAAAVAATAGAEVLLLLTLAPAAGRRPRTH